VVPFKPQNMSNNAAVTADGGEIGRAQALQARAARIAPVADMNPVLLKPQSETGAQVVVQGKVFATARAAEYHALKPQLMARVTESYERLSAKADLVLVEGAGSPAEINLRAGDIANMGFAAAADLPVLLVGDIDRGGVIAAFAGTMALLSADERARVKGAIVNKFRGDLALFDAGRAAIETHAGIPCLGVVPWFAQAHLLPAEDGAALSQRYVRRGGAIRIRVPRLPAIANFDDLDPLAAEADVDLALLEPGEALPGECDAVLLPGSKATISDLAFLRAQGWDIDIRAHARRGGTVVGLCGGYQMLGRTIADPGGIEGPAGRVPGLGLLPVDTVLEPAKTLREVDATDALSGCRIRGYEIHLGRTSGEAAPFLSLDGTAEGSASADGRVAGSYVHGLFASDTFRARWLGALRAGRNGGAAFDAQVEATLDALARHVEASLDLDRLLEIARCA
jgi:adenosylcobyric acid synthase